MKPRNPSELRRIIAQTTSKLSAGLDQIPSAILKHLSQNAFEVISNFLNQSLLSGKFKTAIKKTKIVPIMQSL